MPTRLNTKDGTSKMPLDVYVLVLWFLCHACSVCTANPATATALAVNISPSPGNAILCMCFASLLHDIWLLIAHEFVSYFLKSPSTLLHVGFRT